MASATSIDISRQSGDFERETVSKALMYHFSAMETIAAKSLTRATTEDGETQAVAKQHMTLEEAERLLHAAGQVPLQGISGTERESPVCGVIVSTNVPPAA
jgi:hypothetical protein